VAVKDGVVTLTGKPRHLRPGNSPPSVRWSASLASARSRTISRSRSLEPMSGRIPDVARAAATAVAWDVEVPDGVTLVVRQGLDHAVGKGRVVLSEGRGGAHSPVPRRRDRCDQHDRDPSARRSQGGGCEREDRKAALARNVEPGTPGISVTTRDDTVTLTGTVRFMGRA